MGDASDLADIRRFMKSPEGRAKLTEVRQRLEGRRIQSVFFMDDTLFVVVKILLDDSSIVDCMMLELSLYAIRDVYDDVLDREYRAERAVTERESTKERVH